MARNFSKFKARPVADGGAARNLPHDFTRSRIATILGLWFVSAIESFKIKRRMAVKGSRPILPIAGLIRPFGMNVRLRASSEEKEIGKVIATKRNFATIFLATCGLASVADAALAEPEALQIGEPHPWQIGMQAAASPIMQMIHWFNGMTLVVITVITLFVLALLLICMLRFNARANPEPSRTSHNTLVEVVWTVFPILILVGIAVPSFALLFAQHDPARAIPGYNPETDPHMTIKATASQWYWSYEYPDNDDLSFDSLMLTEAERAEDPNAGPRLLAVDNELVVPTGTVVHMQVIGADVIHAFAVPAFGVKIDAVPGRLNETWFRVDHEGIYYGQCSELCGRDHAFMPIAVRAVSPDIFAKWVETAQSDLDSAYQGITAAYDTATQGKVASAAD
jgi:cytochrome c oxidase subunit II